MPDKRAANELASKRVLAVDDAEGMLEVLEGFLEEIGFGTVYTASSGAAALERLQAVDGKVDLIVTDIRMPEMNGYEFIRRVRLGAVPACKDVPILILTGYYSEDDRRQARLHRIQSYVLKPPTIDVVETEVRSVLGLARRPIYR